MNIYRRKQQWKLLLLACAIAIGIASLWYTNRLVKQLSEEERKKVHLWAEAVRHLQSQLQTNEDVNFSFEVVRNNTSVPVILTDEKQNIVSFRNLDSTKASDKAYLAEQLRIMKIQHEPIEITYYKEYKNYIYYKDSILLTQLRYYPVFQLGVIALFLMVSYLAFNTSRKAEQNQVWVGMAKETAHQLGTPLSSLIAWVEYLKLKGMEDEMTVEIEKDVNRLNTIAERFSKIGSAPVLKKGDVVDVIKNIVQYVKSRTGKKVVFSFLAKNEDPIYANINIPLFEWVIENLCKNAIDAMTGIGKIELAIAVHQHHIYIDVKDTGKGIPKNKFKTIFNPGYTTKNRGWGLGLTLAKRIVEEYHSGHIFVKDSEPGKGTTFRIIIAEA